MKIGKLYISPGFLLAVLLGVLGLQEEGLGVGILAACIAHEGMHLLFIRVFGGGLRSLRLTLGGARILIEQGDMSYGGELISVMAGPGINLLLCALSAGGGEEWYLFSGVNLVLGVFNLLPLPGLDGGRMIRLLFLMLTEWGEK